MTPELTKYLQELGGYAAVVEAIVLIWVTTQWLRAIGDKQKWQEGCKTCLTGLLTQSMNQTNRQVEVTQQNTSALQKMSADVSVMQQLIHLLENGLPKGRTR